MIINKFKGWDVLVVDDEPDSLEVARRWLMLAGANVLTATNGKDGLAAAREKKPRFILADLTMPVMDGWEMQFELKRDPSTAHIPVIALTAHAMQGVKERALTAGFVDHIPKPLQAQKFIFQVYQIVASMPQLASLIKEL
jgi:CheY-like chemotaxis protein